jgi:hypothetical protein
VLLTHHSPIDGLSGKRRRLIDAGQLRRCIAARGADLILHGHEPAFNFGQVNGPEGPVPVFGSPSASRLAADPALMAQYQVYEIDWSAGGWRILDESRVYSPGSGSFVRSARSVVAQQNGTLALHPETDAAACRRSA